jgi:type III secretory pathway lipoprotein EscJ
MRPIAIVPRPGHEIGAELHDAIACLRNTGIHARKAIAGQAFALLWVEDESIAHSVETLRNAGFHATALTTSDVRH